MPPALKIVERTTPLTRALERLQPGAYDILTVALHEGVAEYEAADRNDIWNVTARFWPISCTFGRSDCDGSPSLREGDLLSTPLGPKDLTAVVDFMESADVSVVVQISLVAYIRAGHELSVHALAVAILEEADRVILLGLPTADNVHELLLARRKAGLEVHGSSADTPFKE